MSDKKQKAPKASPSQHPIEAPAIRDRLLAQIVALMRDNDAPAEAYRRFGLPACTPVQTASQAAPSIGSHA